MKTISPVTCRGILMVALGISLGAVNASAQLDQRAQPEAGRRQQLEQRFRVRVGQLMRQRLQLDDAQVIRLEAVNRQFEQQRVSLTVRERALRRELRQQLTPGGSANEARVAELLDQTISLQRQRLDIVDAEQRELAKFLKPIQRARYFGLQNELRKRMQDLRNPAAPANPNARRLARPNRLRGLN